MKLNHVANRIVAGNLEIVLEFFTTQLNFKLLRRTPGVIWLRQNASNVDIQFTESAETIAQTDRHESHVSFLSRTPEADLKRLADWFRAKRKTAEVGSWSPKEFYLDVPEVFLDFAVEAMLPELADYDV